MTKSPAVRPRGQPTDAQVRIGCGNKGQAAHCPCITHCDCDASLENLYDRYHRQALGLATNIVRRTEMAEEVVLEAYLDIWRSRSHAQSRSSTRTRLMASIRQRALVWLRAQPVSSISSHAKTFDIAAPLGRPLNVRGTDSGALVRRALAGLARQQRRTLELAYFEGLGRHEMAARLGISIATATHDLRAAFDEVQRQLGGDQGRLSPTGVP